MSRTTDEQFLELDVPAAIAAGRLSGETMVAAAIRADRLDVLPRSLTFLAEVVRRGGAAYAAGLPEPLPTPEQSELAKTWLESADDVGFARWLDGVAAVLEARRAVRLR
jgi:hypothetical protein